ncbi:hypothetical protein ACFTXM_18925 [Streptomyces sp. NPDC056930]|uniref:hypothetical protein n=1 Tax=Streptomyces sp. NPDC056930 TaxID=3345967 RepID=UPI003629BB70
MTRPTNGGNGAGGPEGGPGELRARPEETGYLVDEGLAIACFLALGLHRPLFCEGDAGVGKTALAETIDWAEALDALGATELDAELAFATLGSVLKYREDAERARSLDLSAVLAARGA